MKITRVLAETIPLASEIRNAHVSFAEMTSVLVAVESSLERNGRRLWGLGFGSIGRYSAAAIVRERLLPRLFSAEPATLLDEEGIVDPVKVWPVVMRNEKQGGHGERSVAVGALDMALWDLAAKARGVPLWSLLSTRFNGGRADERVEVYAAGGYYHVRGGEDALRREIAGYLAQGYRRVKIKIGGAPLEEDFRRTRAAAAEAGSAAAVAVDANGRFDLATAVVYGSELRALGVRWFEEAGDPLDFDLQERLGAECPMPFATGENLFSSHDVRNLVRYAGLQPDRDYLQMDPALSYGIPEYLRILSILEEQGWSRRRCIPHGGHQFSLHVAAGLQIGGNEAYPGIFQPLGGFADDMKVEDGHVRLPDLPGIGIEAKSALMAAFQPMLG